MYDPQDSRQLGAVERYGVIVWARQTLERLGIDKEIPDGLTTGQIHSWVMQEKANVTSEAAWKAAHDAGATDVPEGFSSAAEMSWLVTDIENHNRREPDNRIAPPGFTAAQYREIAAYRRQAEASRNPFYNDPNGDMWAVTGEFGDHRENGRVHIGFDLFASDAALGTPMESAWYGTIHMIHDGDTWDDRGRYVVIKLDEDMYGPEKYINFQHLDGVNVTEGQVITPGMVFGAVGNTGGTGGWNGYGDVHAHIEVWVGGGTRNAAVDPLGIDAVDLDGNPLLNGGWRK